VGGRGGDLSPAAAAAKEMAGEKSSLIGSCNQ
jgi:hypothetical protein